MSDNKIKIEEHVVSLEAFDFHKVEKSFMEVISKDFSEAGDITSKDYAIKSFLLYGASAVAGRAIPHLRDGMKHGQRRAMWAMKEMGLSHSGSYKKAARVVGDIIGKYHPHGDTAAYEAIVNMAQPWKKNLTLADGQGNWGSIDEMSDYAAMRYTEVRMTKASTLMFTDIDKNTVNFIANYDGSEQEPEFLPTPFPNVLINGIPAGSIAVGMSSSILPHNSTEVMNAMLQMIKDRKVKKETTAEELLEFISAPDFPTGGYVYNTGNMIDIIKTGRGSVKLRAKHHVEDLPRGKSAIVITEIPWAKKKTNLIQSVVDLSKNAEKDNKIANAILKIKDDSAEDIRIIIEVKSGYDPEIVWNYIMKNTEFDTSHSYFSVVLDTVTNSHGELASAPREMGLLEILNKYLDFRFEYFRRKHQYLVNKYEDRVHILEGLIKAIDMIDKIISIIRGAENPESARGGLIKLDFTEAQAKAIMDMRLSRLTKLPKQEFLDEHKDLNEKLLYSTKILKDYIFQSDELIKETEEVAKAIAFPRRSVIKNELSGMDMEDIIPKEDCMVYVTHKGYVKRVSSKNINKQNRGTQGKKGIELTEDDFVEKIFNTNTHSIIMFVMSDGHVYGTKAYNVPDSNRGSFIENLFEITEGQKIVNVVEVEDFETHNILFVTRGGTIKSSSLTDYKGSIRKSGVKGIGLSENDAVVSVKTVVRDTEEEVVIATYEGKAIRFGISDISVTGRTSMGVRGIKLKDDNYVIGSSILSKGTLVATITEFGMVKISDYDSFKTQNRGGVGVNCMNLTKKSGNLNSIVSWDIDEHFDLVTITKSGVLNRIDTRDIRTTSRNTKGVKLTDLKKDDSIVSVLKTEHETEEEIVEIEEA